MKHSVNFRWRNTHPRCRPDSKAAAIESPRGGNARQFCLIDMRGIVG